LLNGFTDARYFHDDLARTEIFQRLESEIVEAC